MKNKEQIKPPELEEQKKKERKPFDAFVLPNNPQSELFLEQAARAYKDNKR